MPPPDGEGPAELLLRKAGDDLTVVEKMVDGKGYPVEIIGFHAQQCCEKAFKSVLSRGGIRHPYTHDLLALIDLMRDGSIDVPEWVEEAARFTPFAVVYRYEDLDLGDVPDLEQVRALAWQVHRWAASIVNQTREI